MQAKYSILEPVTEKPASIQTTMDLDRYIVEHPHRGSGPIRFMTRLEALSILVGSETAGTFLASLPTAEWF